MFNYLSFDKISDIELNDLKEYANRKNQVVVVELGKDNFLTFLVVDCEKPKIPGYPATSIEYFKSHKEAEKEIEKLYQSLQYVPNFYKSKAEVK